MQGLGISRNRQGLAGISRTIHTPSKRPFLSVKFLRSTRRSNLLATIIFGYIKRIKYIKTQIKNNRANLGSLDLVATVNKTNAVNEVNQ